jgi:LysM repeat protein
MPIGDILTKDTAGIPNWAWIAIIVAGIAAAYVVPKFLGNTSSTTSSTDTSGSSGLGLAIDPTTGLPYAVEGLVPSGAYAGGGTTVTPVSTPGVATPPPIPAPTVTTSSASKSPVVTSGAPAQTKPIPASTAKYATVTSWPTPLSTLSGIASRYGISLQRLEQLNPQIKNPNLIYSGQQVRIA